MAKHLLLLLFFVTASQFLFSQTDSIKLPIKGDVVIFQDVRIDTLIQRIYTANEENPKIDGYRIQIYSGSNRTIANQVKAAFLTEYRVERAYLIYNQPYFKVRVGNFRSKTEALKLYTALRADEKFKAVLIVADEIDLPDLIEYTSDEVKD